MLERALGIAVLVFLTLILLVVLFRLLGIEV